MLSSNGEIAFTTEVMDLVDRFLQDYQELKGPLNNDLERGLVIVYVLGVMRCDLERVWASLGSTSVFGSLQPRSLFEECTKQNQELRDEQRSALIDAMKRRGWLDGHTAVTSAE